jgi:predicted AlkP superfamily pyrophosphatase or phosphodiesterase
MNLPPSDVTSDLEDGFDIVFVYANVIDHVGHVFGPDALQVSEAVKVSHVYVNMSLQLSSSSSG